MFPWGSAQRPVIVKVSSEERAGKVVQICQRYGMHYILGLKPVEDLTDLKNALKERLTLANSVSVVVTGTGPMKSIQRIIPCRRPSCC